MRCRFCVVFLAYLGLALCLFAATGCSRQPNKSSTEVDPLRAAILEYQTRLQEINRARIIGGQFADPGQFKWQVGLIKAGFAPKDGVFCGGTVIAPRWILTAAHCFAPGTQGPDQDVFVGSIYLDPNLVPKAGERLQVARIFVHTGYNSLTYDSDIALLLLSSETKLGEPIPLLQPDEASTVLAARRQGRVSGWGRIVENGPTSARLKYVDVPFADQIKCAANYRKLNSSYIVTSNMLCAGFDAANQGDACDGDSGGPLVVPVDGLFKLAGAVSWGNGCSRAGLYGLYTRVVNFLPWIDGYVKGDLKSLESQAGGGTPQVSASADARTLPAPAAEWMAHVNWSTTNTDAGPSTDCPSQYPYPGCIASGGRACLMTQAIASAKANDCANAFRVTQVTQCHNPRAQELIANAGQDAICRYLKSK